MRRGRPSPVQHLIWRGAARDPGLSARVRLVAGQVAPVSSLLTPSVLWRAATARPSPNVPGERTDEPVPADAQSSSQ
jgi:hypothetical protein